MQAQYALNSDCYGEESCGDIDSHAMNFIPGRRVGPHPPHQGRVTSLWCVKSAARVPIYHSV